MDPQLYLGLIVMGAFFLLLILLMAVFAFARPSKDQESPDGTLIDKPEDEKGRPIRNRRKRAA